MKNLRKIINLIFWYLILFQRWETFRLLKATFILSSIKDGVEENETQ